MKSSQSIFIPVRGLRYHVRRWEAELQRGAPHGPDVPVLVFLHGWMDTSASFQFVIDALAGHCGQSGQCGPWTCVAPDWRGFGLTQSNGGDSYWFPDYLADLDALLDALVPGVPAVLIGHSMGGNIALMYAGVRPDRVRAVVNLEGFGLRSPAAQEAPLRYARWLDQLKTPATMREYAALDAVAERLRQSNARLTPERAQFLAAHWAQPLPQGGYRIAADPAHKRINPVLYRWEEVAACWRRIECPVLWIEGALTDALKWAGDRAEVDRRRGLLRDLRTAVLDGAGHMLHHDQPAAVADCVCAFLAGLPHPKQPAS